MVATGGGQLSGSRCDLMWKWYTRVCAGTALNCASVLALAADWRLSGEFDAALYALALVLVLAGGFTLAQAFGRSVL